MPPPVEAEVAELVDARDLKSLEALLRAGSIPALGTNGNQPGVTDPLGLLLHMGWIGYVMSRFA